MVLNTTYQTKPILWYDGEITDETSLLYVYVNFKTWDGYLGTNSYHYLFIRFKVFRWSGETITQLNKASKSFVNSFLLTLFLRGNRGRDRMVVGFTTTCAISVYHHWCCELEPRSYQDVHDTLCDKVCQWLTTGRRFSMGTPVSRLPFLYKSHLEKIRII